MTILMIQADGIVWPLQTYLDARAFRRVDPFATPDCDGQLRVETVTLQAELQPCRYASSVAWHNVLAWRPVDIVACRCCGDPVASLGDDLCDDCDDAWGMVE
ncbi:MULTISPECIES: hypothetical protein [unclassified Sphingomonas]|uniref:hypothetical protein n=1 Tax=unclassified Sphingomonas TaxID=196159 RepID=UPI002269AF5F|nr:MULTISPECIES: hypothetical protein [unclassified Sphingomonas]